MDDSPVYAADHLEMLAHELIPYDGLNVTIVRRSSGPSYLRVVSTDAADLAETISCEARSRSGTPAYMWSWGEEIVGATLADKAHAIAYVLHAVPTRI
jgi:hypothetical protein